VKATLLILQKKVDIAERRVLFVKTASIMKTALTASNHQLENCVQISTIV
jgi:hypothetical protein